MDNNLWNTPCIIEPSLISVCDLCNLEASVRLLEKSGVQALHVDILDGHFSPSMPLGLDTVRQLRKRTDLPFDVHLMASSNDYFVDELLDIGIQQLVFHIETEPHPDHRLEQIHQAGVRAGVALKPGTSLSCLDYILEKCDAVLLTLINPGYAGFNGEKQAPYADRKVRELHEGIHQAGLGTKVIVDGRISRENIARYTTEGTADIFVAGSTCTDKHHLPESFAELAILRDTWLKEKK